MINFTKLSQNIFDRGFVDISGSDLHKKNREIENNSSLFSVKLKILENYFFREIEDYLET